MVVVVDGLGVVVVVVVVCGAAVVVVVVDDVDWVVPGEMSLTQEPAG